MTPEREPRECPFCGKAADVHLAADAAACGGISAFVKCPSCMASGPKVYPGGGKVRTDAAQRRAVRMWNRREGEVRRDVPNPPDSWETLDMDLRDAARSWDEEHPGEGIGEYVGDILDRMHSLAAR